MWRRLSSSSSWARPGNSPDHGALRLRADDHREPGRAVVGAAAVLLGAAAELAPDVDQHAVGEAARLEVGLERGQRLGEHREVAVQRCRPGCRACRSRRWRRARRPSAAAPCRASPRAPPAGARSRPRSGRAPRSATARRCPGGPASWPRRPTVCLAALRAERSSASSVASVPWTRSASISFVRRPLSQTSRASSEKYSGLETAATGTFAAASAGASVPVERQALQRVVVGAVLVEVAAEPADAAERVDLADLPVVARREVRLVGVAVADRRHDRDLARDVEVAQRRGARVPVQARVLGEHVGGVAARGQLEVRPQLRVAGVADRREHRQRVEPAGEEDRDEHRLRRAPPWARAMPSSNAIRDSSEPPNTDSARPLPRARKERRLRPVPAGVGMPGSMPRRPRPAWARE